VRLAILAVLVALGAATAVPADAKAKGWAQPAAGATMTGDPEVIFTFDDGPDPEKTPIVLDILAQHHIKAIFFMVGRNVADPKAAPVLARILREGHIIANHTMHHGDLCGIKEDADAAAEIDDGANIIKKVSDWTPIWFRAPYGVRCDRVDAMLAERNITHFHWDLDPQEWRHNNTKRAVAYLIKQFTMMKGRNVLLMHDIKKATVEALPQLFEWLDAENARRAELRIRRIRIIQAPEVAMERLPAGLLDWLGEATPGRDALSRAVASVLP
jgi:peptidoglycan/xylan/chitin deacetylase (PgdA/CDA1 family)